MYGTFLIAQKVLYKNFLMLWKKEGSSMAQNSYFMALWWNLFLEPLFLIKVSCHFHVRLFENYDFHFKPSFGLGKSKINK